MRCEYNGGSRSCCKMRGGGVGWYLLLSTHKSKILNSHQGGLSVLSSDHMSVYNHMHCIHVATCQQGKKKIVKFINVISIFI